MESVYTRQPFKPYHASNSRRVRWLSSRSNQAQLLAGPVCCRTAPKPREDARLPLSSTTRFRSSGIHWRTAPITVGDSVPILAFLHDNLRLTASRLAALKIFRSVRLRNRVWRFSAYVDFPKPRAFERSRCRGGRFAWFDRAIAMSQNKIGVSRKMSIEIPI